jgi:hypothetical protein
MFRWWVGKLAMGTQLTLAGHPVLGYDVQGNGPWFRWVATEELVMDMEQRSGYKVPKHEFHKSFKSVTRQTHKEKRKAYWPIKREIHQLEFRNFTRFESLEHCRLLAYNPSGVPFRQGD